MARLTGTITYTQEGRFQLADDGGGTRFFVLSSSAGVSIEELQDLWRGGRRVVVRYQPGQDWRPSVAQEVSSLEGAA